MSRVFIGIGSNEGDRWQAISEAAKRLNGTDGIRVVQMATILETEPVGGPPQDPYLNTALEIETTLAPEALLAALKAVEQRGGRAPGGPRWGPRPLDLDLLLYEDQIIRTEVLQVPHPRLHERRFALEPLADLDPALPHPALHRTIQELLHDAH